MNRFIVFEGGEGSGKSTAADAVAGQLRAEGLDVVHTREPGGTAAGEAVRGLLHLDLAPWAEAFAFLVARAQVVAEVIRPALERGAVVICDRYEASFLAYQGFGRGLDLASLRTANEIAADGVHPGLTVFLDLDPAVGLRRKRGETEAIRIGLETLEFHQRVRQGYLSLMGAAPRGSWARLDAAGGPAEVAHAAAGAVRAVLADGGTGR